MQRPSGEDGICRGAQFRVRSQAYTLCFSLYSLGLCPLPTLGDLYKGNKSYLTSTLGFEALQFKLHSPSPTSTLHPQLHILLIMIPDTEVVSHCKYNNDLFSFSNEAIECCIKCKTITHWTHKNALALC